MLVTCSSCNSKYLVNSADLKPNGRNVQCAKCGYNWFQVVSQEEENLTSSVPSSNNHLEKNITPNLPVTYESEQKASILNSILVIIFLFSIFSTFWLFKNYGINIMVLVKFYLQEFYFNFKLIISDFAEIVYQILN